MGGTHFLQTGYLLLNRNAPCRECFGFVFCCLKHSRMANALKLHELLEIVQKLLYSKTGDINHGK